MTPIRALLGESPAARRFFAAYLQSALGNGVGYVALVLVAYERFHSPWAVAAILIADLVPLMALGPLLGGAADRLARRPCVVAADLVRAGAFLGIALTGNLALTLGLAVLAGAGTGVFNPAALAGLPDLAGERHIPAATSLFSALSTLGKTVGPVLAAAVLLGGGVDAALLANAASFLVSGLVLLTVDLGTAGAAADGDTPPPPAVSLRGLGGFGLVAVVSSGAALFAGMSNVAEPSFIVHDLDATTAAFSLMVGLWGVGVAVGSLAGSGGGGASRLWFRYLTGIATMGAGYAIAALAPSFALALPGFVVAGVGNGLLLVHERLLIQALVPERARGRAFGTLDMVASWAFAAALGLGALAVAGPGPRDALLAAGVGTLALWAGAALTTVARAARAPVPETP